MIIELLLFISVGFFAGVSFGLVPGLHPNTMIIMLPIVLSLMINPILIIVFVVSMAVSNSVVDTIPSIILGAPDEGKELGVLPGHRMLLDGMGFEAIKLVIVGCTGACIFIIIVLPIILFSMSFIYEIIKPAIFLLIGIFSFYMIFSEKGNKKIIGFVVFCFCGIVGILSSNLPIDSNLLLFPILSGFFGISSLMLQIKNKVKIPSQNGGEIKLNKKFTFKGVILGSLGGLFSGFLPGVGSSQIASLLTGKNPQSFLVTMGALSSTNTIMSILSLWLIGKSRSGAAVIIEQLTEIGFIEFLVIFFVFVFCTGMSCIFTLRFSKKFVKIIERIDYTKTSLSIIFLIFFFTAVLTGFYGIFLLIICSAMGIYVNMTKIKRGIMMGVLLVPTILFFLFV